MERTRTGRGVSPRLLFVEGGRGRLLLTCFATDAPAAPTWVHVPAFAEEMNKARRMVALTARALAASGAGVVCVDPFGTGDSEGDFGDATWALWREDLARITGWLRDQGHTHIVLWGLRAGCLLALDALRAGLLEGVRRVVLWQPILSGEQFLAQFLRLRTAGALLRGGAPEKPGDLRRAWARGEVVEVAGYRVGAALAEPLSALRLAALVPAKVPAVDWFEVHPEGTPSGGGARVRESWSAAGRAVRFGALAGAPFWSTQEIALVPALIEATARPG